MSDLKDALKQLDVNNDDHWTKGGLPMVDVVSHFHGETVTRSDIAEVWPDFTRDVAIAEANPPVAPSAASINSTPTKDDITSSASIDPSGAVADEHVEEEVDAIDLIEKALAAAQTPRYAHNYELHAFIRQFHTQQVPIRAAQNRIDERNARRGK